MLIKSYYKKKLGLVSEHTFLVHVWFGNRNEQFVSFSASKINISTVGDENDRKPENRKQSYARKYRLACVVKSGDWTDKSAYFVQPWLNTSAADPLSVMIHLYSIYPAIQYRTVIRNARICWLVRSHTSACCCLNNVNPYRAAGMRPTITNECYLCMCVSFALIKNRLTSGYNPLGEFHTDRLQDWQACDYADQFFFFVILNDALTPFITQLLITYFLKPIILLTLLI